MSSSPSIPDIARAIAEAFGRAPRFIHTAMPPVYLGGASTDVVELELHDGTTAYVTAGASLGASTRELVLRARVPTAGLPQLMARLGGWAFHHGVAPGTLPLAGPEAPFPALGFLYGDLKFRVGERSIWAYDAIGLTGAELDVARRDGTLTVDGALWLDGTKRVSLPNRETSKSLPHPTEFWSAGLERGVSRYAEKMRAILDADGEACEGLRDEMSKVDAGLLAGFLGPTLRHPEQISALLHLTMDFLVPELRVPAMRLLQVAPGATSFVGGYYRDALSLLDGLDASEDGLKVVCAALSRYEDAELAAAAAAARRHQHGLPVLWS